MDNREYSGPCILHGDTILTNANSYQLSSGLQLLDGRPKLIMNPLTGVEQPWQISRAYGCNNIASENMLTFRSGAAGYYDLETMSGTGNLGGFKSGCTSNLVVANGLLNAPDYTQEDFLTVPIKTKRRWRWSTCRRWICGPSIIRQR
ncbi:MAG: hypothetical protein R3C28_15215 [Pirellulaceae bacterium]